MLRYAAGLTGRVMAFFQTLSESASRSCLSSANRAGGASGMTVLCRRYHGNGRDWTAG